MLDVLLLRLDAPFVSFGGPIVDNHGVTQDHPSHSLLVGMLANALGYEHRDAARTEELQSRLQCAMRCDRFGKRLVDYQTADLGQTFLVDAGWTTRGVREDRAGGSAKEGTHIRYRHYLADSVYTVALTLVPADADPTLDDIEQALKEPSRPLFIGRKCCIPSGNLFIRRTRTETLFSAVENEPRLPSARVDDADSLLQAWWPAEERPVADSRLISVTDERDWANQIHTGERQVRHGLISPPGGA